MSKCIVCNKPGNLRCARCRSVNYCSANCQKTHWSRGHKGECKILSSTETKQFINNNDTKSDATKALSEQLSKISLLDESATKVSKREELSIEQYLFPQKRVQQMLQFLPEYMNVGVGLHNFMNSCYMNSVLQCFTYTLPLFNYLISQDHSKKCRLSETDQFCMICALENHLFNVLLSKNSYYAPRYIYGNLRAIGDFAFFQQEDAHDFAYAVLNSMQKSILTNLDKKASWKEEESTLIYQLFGGYIQSQIKCNSCSSLYTSYESFLDLMLDLSESSSLEEALQSYTNVETLDESVGWRCEKCQKAVSAQKQLTIYNSPNILCLTLKRFDLMQGGFKINKPIVFREQLSLKRVMSKHSPDTQCDYELYGIVVHFGQSIFAGHYVAFVKIDDGWVLFDDDKVVEVDASVVLKQNAYMMYYRKVAQKQQATSIASNPSIIGAKKARGSKKTELPTISTSSAASAPESASISTPFYRVYYRMSPNDDSQIQDVVVQVELPELRSLGGSSLEVSENGEFSLSVEQLYALQMHLPFKFDLSNTTSADMFAGVNGKPPLLVVILPLPHPDAKRDFTNKKNLKFVALQDSSKLVALKLDPENEVTVSAEEPSKPKTAPAKANVEETTYSKLYHDIRGQQQSASTTSSAPKAQQPPKKIAGRNDDCPCGSGKKYKKCHGAR